MNISMREAVAADQKQIADFNNRLAEETEGRSLDSELILPGVAALLADPSKGRYWIAMSGSDVAGQIMVTYEWSDWRNGMLWWIQSVYVPPEFRRQGVFSAMYKHVESLATADADACGLRLYLEKNNERAKETYLSLGMKEPGYQVMQAIF